VNTKKKFYVIRNSNPDAGMGSLISSVLGHLIISENNKRIPIVDWGYYKCLYTESDSTLNTFNPWEYFFQPVADYRLIDLSELDDVLYTDGSHPTNIRFPWANSFQNQNIFRNYIKFNENTTAYLKSGITDLNINSNTLGVHFRAAKHMRTMTNHPIQPSRSQLKKIIDMELNSGEFTKILFATDVENELSYFKKRYGSLLVSFQSERFKKGQDTTPKVLGNRNHHNYLLGLEVLREAYALSISGGLIAGYSGVSQLAEVMRLPNTKYRTFLIDNGRLSHYKIIARYQFKAKSLLPRIMGGFQ